MTGNARVDSSAARPARPTRAGALLRSAIVAQVVLAAVVLAVPFGFDQRSSLGLDCGHLLVVLGGYAVSLTVEVAAGAVGRRWGAVALQVAVPLAVAALVFTGVLPVGSGRPRLRSWPAG